jgi:hypothetical protein
MAPGRFGGRGRTPLRTELSPEQYGFFYVLFARGLVNKSGSSKKF